MSVIVTCTIIPSRTMSWPYMDTFEIIEPENLVSYVYVSFVSGREKSTTGRMHGRYGIENGMGRENKNKDWKVGVWGEQAIRWMISMLYLPRVNIAGGTKRGRNWFRYEYKCRSASALRFRLINSERAGSLSVIVSSIIAEIRFVSCRYSGKSVHYRGEKIVFSLRGSCRVLWHRWIVFRSLVVSFVTGLLF